MVPPKRLPIKGSFIGNRNSWLNMSTASPPIGKPVQGSRGPASFRPKPRSVVAPPAKKRSGNGITSSATGGAAERLFKAETRGPREDECPAERMKRRVLKKAAKEACAGTECGRSNAQIYG